MTDPLELLRALFIERCRTDLERLRRLESDDPDLGPIAHQLAGSAGSFGYPEVSEAAAVVDDRARYGPTPAPEEVQTLLQALERAIGTPHHTRNPDTPT
ncbi:Hpt domain-containing protein [Brevundimonas sp.]|uniref:Hpt domain-containing protein n=1 Tax=Brevundimonas sp. TaxID=1871086 RepID=UPI002D38A5D4|nr:Hpt domain-containing protein [Brevundimonas sp.]HYC98393.1 Hpt domain-containing protein [Brevundimonas sp.]